MKTNKLAVGILAHVDAGKTTLAESILYLTGSIRKLGRVDHQDAFLDTYDLERERGITIFSKQAEVRLGEKEVTLLDTPGHVDFSAEMERTLQVLDYAVLVISGADGVQGHVQTLWRLLTRYKIPVFLFINKMDQEGTDRRKLLVELQKRLDERCIAFDDKEDRETFFENLAMSDEAVLEKYLSDGTVEPGEIIRLIRERKVFPCYFGSALKIDGVEEFLQGLDTYTVCPDYPEDFGARVYKIARDTQGARLTYMKITGGILKVKQMLTNRREEKESSEEIWEEKADQLRIYSGAGFRTISEAPAGTVCAVTGLSWTFCGQGLGAETEAELPLLEPVLTYQIQIPPECDVHRMYLKLRQLEEEEPELHIVWEEQSNEIHAQVMGEVQIEILKRLIAERFDTEVEFGAGSIVYKETITEPVEGVGHFEPLRHYAEVHLLMEPGERGSGLQFEAACSEDILERNWQRLVLTHLEEKRHRGVLTGSEITDMKITLVTGRAHLKHTEGGDFRQATYRAVRHGLKCTNSLLLEPVYEYRLEIPSDKVGRALSDIQKMYGTFSEPVIEGDMTILTGTAPVAAMRDYQTEVVAYTKGHGRLSCTLKGYEPCHNAEEVIREIAYDPEKDTENPTGSVFCSHGAGFVVSWDKVRDYMHLDSGIRLEKKVKPIQEQSLPTFSQTIQRGGPADEKELEEIFTRTYGTAKKERNSFNRKRTVSAETSSPREYKPKKQGTEEEYLLVDGYNIIFAWEGLRDLANASIEAARNKLMDILSNYQGYKKNTLILVYDAYKVEGNTGEVMKYHNIYVVYTKEAETADQYIEKTVHEIGRKHRVTVATSDALEQIIILGQGASRLSAAGLKEEIQAANIEIRSNYLNQGQNGKNYLFDHLSDELQGLMEDVRMGRKKL
ncbi:translation factor GTPase family protein [Blautia marasmi]|uniref:translation factor GTPase family protein n=1 Tax=Blautia marasmi TaxID=1917868 RepID=UPI00266DD689|nr:TetM/TetW/TetO/TetS family tetracycline resistance ribosomal protection protein [Blautia marasmi]